MDKFSKMMQPWIKDTMEDNEVPNKEYEIEKEERIEKKEQEQVVKIDTGMGQLILMIIKFGMNLGSLEVYTFHKKLSDIDRRRSNPNDVDLPMKEILKHKKFRRLDTWS